MNRKFKLNSQRRRGRSSLPFVFVNFAMTADGKIAFADRTFVPFGSTRDREHMMELRATADAVMSGARTVDSGEVSMGTGGEKYRHIRQRRGLQKYNLRIIVSGSGSIDPDAHIFKMRFSPIIILTTQRAGARKVKQLRALANDVKICGEKEIDFAFALRWLRQEWNVKRLLCEGGGELHSALLRANVVDELHLTICPTVFGGHNAPTIADGRGSLSLMDATLLELKSLKRFADEVFLCFRVVKSALRKTRQRPLLVSTQRAKSQSKSARRLR